MGLFHYFWKVWLRINRPGMTAINDCFAEVSTENFVKSNDDIAERLAMEGIDVNYNTLIYVINQYDRAVRDLVCEGFSVHTGNVVFTPRISGEWDSNSAEFYPEKHKRVVDCTLTPDMCHALDVVGVEVLGVKDSFFYISRITDVKSGVTDAIISRNGEIIIEGNGIKAVAKDGTYRNCIFLIKANKTAFDIAENIIVNESNKVVLRTPVGLERGDYHLMIHTYYSEEREGAQKYYHCIEFDKKLTVK